MRVDAGASEPTLLVAPGALGTELPPPLIGVDPDPGAERVRHRFPPQRDGRTGGLGNEITEDAAGNVYASDSFGARIPRIAAADRTAPDRAAVWTEGAELAAPMFGVNGIAFDGADALLAANTTTGTLHRIALADAAIACRGSVSPPVRSTSSGMD